MKNTGAVFRVFVKNWYHNPHIKFCIEEIANGILVSFIKQQGELASAVSTGEVKRLLQVCDGERSRSELQQALGLKHEEHFRAAYLLPSLELGVLEMTRPKTPKSRLQRYRRTPKGSQLV